MSPDYGRIVRALARCPMTRNIRIVIHLEAQRYAERGPHEPPLSFDQMAHLRRLAIVNSRHLAPEIVTIAQRLQAEQDESDRRAIAPRRKPPSRTVAE